MIKTIYAGGAKEATGGGGGSGGGDTGGGSDTFEAQLLLDNIVNSGTKKTEKAVVNETVAVLKNILGE